MAASPARRTGVPGKPSPAGEGSGPTLDPTGPAGRAVRLRHVALAFVVVAAGALGLANVGAALADPAPMPPTATPIADPFGWLQPWVRFDSNWYYEIATGGYFYTPGQQSSVAFFPTYPLLMDLLDPTVGTFLAGVLLTVVAGLGCVLLFSIWCSARLTRPAAVTALGLLLLYPYSFYLYGAVYADAVFMLCALGAFVLLERGHPVLAGLVGALATAGRPLGVAVALGLAVRAVELAGRRSARQQVRAGSAGSDDRPGRSDWPAWYQRVRSGVAASRRSLRLTRWSDAGVLLAFSGLGGYMAYQWAAFGTPVAFVLAESAPGWDQGTGPRVWLKVAFVETLLGGDLDESARVLLPALLCLAIVLLLPRIRRRFGWGYAVLTAVAVAVPLVGTKDFMGTGRYLLVAFPAFAAVGELLHERWPHRGPMTVLTVSAIMLVVTTTAYGYGYLVS